MGKVVVTQKTTLWPVWKAVAWADCRRYCWIQELSSHEPRNGHFRGHELLPEDPGGYTVAVRRRRSAYGGDGVYTVTTEAIRNDCSVTAPPKKLNMFNLLSRYQWERRRITGDDGRPRRAWRISAVDYGEPRCGDPWPSVAHTVNV